MRVRGVGGRWQCFGDKRQGKQPPQEISEKHKKRKNENIKKKKKNSNWPPQLPPQSSTATHSTARHGTVRHSSTEASQANPSQRPSTRTQNEQATRRQLVDRYRPAKQSRHRHTRAIQPAHQAVNHIEARQQHLQARTTVDRRYNNTHSQQQRKKKTKYSRPNAGLPAEVPDLELDLFVV